jgi:hypothetical protein
MDLGEHLKIAVRAALNETFALEIQEIVANETRIIFRENEAQFNHIIRSAVKEAFDEMLKEE